MPNNRILNFREVTALTSISAPTLRRWIAADRFPAPLRLGKRRIGWPEITIARWLREQRTVR
jgi:prophage regulatory protein